MTNTSESFITLNARVKEIKEDREIHKLEIYVDNAQGVEVLEVPPRGFKAAAVRGFREGDLLEIRLDKTRQGIEGAEMTGDDCTPLYVREQPIYIKNLRTDKEVSYQ